MKRRIRVALGALGVLGALVLCACGPVNPVIGTGESSVLVTNDLGTAITSLEVLAGAPEGFETILPTEDVETIDPGQTVQVNYEVGQATYNPGTVGSGQTDQTSNEPIAEPTSNVGEAPNAVQVDRNGNQTSEIDEDALFDEALGVDTSTDESDTATASGTSPNPSAKTSTTSSDSMPIVGDAIRVVAGGKTLVFDGLDLPDYKEVSLRTSNNGVNYVDYVDVNDQTGNTKAAATTAMEQWEAAQKQANGDKATTGQNADAATATDQSASANTNANANTNATAGSGSATGGATSAGGKGTGSATGSSGSNSNSNTNATAPDTVDQDEQGINGDGLGTDEAGNEADDRYEGGFDPETGEPVSPSDEGGIADDGRDPNE